MARCWAWRGAGCVRVRWCTGVVTSMKPPDPHSWQRILHGLSNVDRFPEFASGTHMEVFGRDFGPWLWLGMQEGHEEYLHGWMLPSRRWWLMLPVHAQMVAYTDAGVMETSPVRLVPFDEAGVGTRQKFVNEIRHETIADREFAGWATKVSIYTPLRTNAVALTRAARLRALSAWAQTDDEKAVSFLFALTPQR
jgi:hypothetical protein